jgi:hypothetical protein
MDLVGEVRESCINRLETDHGALLWRDLLVSGDSWVSVYPEAEAVGMTSGRRRGWGVKEEGREEEEALILVPLPLPTLFPLLEEECPALLGGRVAERCPARVEGRAFTPVLVLLLVLVPGFTEETEADAEVDRAGGCCCWLDAEVEVELLRIISRVEGGFTAEVLTGEAAFRGGGRSICATIFSISSRSERVILVSKSVAMVMGGATSDATGAASCMTTDEDSSSECSAVQRSA